MNTKQAISQINTIINEITNTILYEKYNTNPSIEQKHDVMIAAIKAAPEIQKNIILNQIINKIKIANTQAELISAMHNILQFTKDNVDDDVNNIENINDEIPF